MDANTLGATKTVLLLCGTYRQLNDEKADIDRRIIKLPPEHPHRDILWQELEASLAQLREVAGLLAKSRAIDIAQLRAKASVLAGLLRSGDAAEGGDQLVSLDLAIALVLSLTDDIAALSG